MEWNRMAADGATAHTAPYHTMPDHAIAACTDGPCTWALTRTLHVSKSHVSAGEIHHTSAAVTVRGCTAHIVHQICQPGAVGHLDTADGATNNIDSSTLVKLIQIKLCVNCGLADL